MSATMPRQGRSQRVKMEVPMVNGGVLGLHHMSAISGPAQENLDFFGGILGLRLVKLTVNFDDPSAYHLYYGNSSGDPGTILTFFPYPSGYPGRPGTGQVTVTSLAIPSHSMAYWQGRFAEHAVDFDRIQRRGGVEHLPFRSPDGLLLELATTHNHESTEHWNGSDVPSEHAILGLRSLTIRTKDIGPTREMLTSLMGFRPTEERDGRYRFEVAEGGLKRTLEVVQDSTGPSGRSGHGTVHHIAFRTATDDSLAEMRAKIVEAGFHVSQIMDREYFKSIYFREPGGVLFEVATDLPGFAVDEPEELLGTQLQLPKQFEAFRGKIEKELPVLRLP